ncbi:SH3 domain-containing protein [Agaricicola taiwanensis]|nr:SH3 domain-containing protein [Agaricicola taiwanensis]
MIRSNMKLGVSLVAAVTLALLSLGSGASAQPVVGGVIGASGLPVPRFVSLKSNQVNVRRGPTVEHQIAWMFKREGLPVEIVAEYENWRRIRDADGAEGWVYHSLLSGRRTAVVAPWDPGKLYELHSDDSDNSRVTASLEAGVLASISRCTGSWCRLSGSGFDGWIRQDRLWGAYPGEKFN